MQEHPSPPSQAVMIDIERERQYWKDRYRSLPRARAMRSFARYWPVLGAAYDVYLNHPRADADEGLRLFLDRESVQGSLLSGAEAGEVFDRVRARIGDRQGPGQARSATGVS